MRTAVGQVVDASGATHGFIRFAKGRIAVFDTPDTGGVSAKATFPVSINDRDEIAGYYTDASDHTRGFIRFPGERK